MSFIPLKLDNNLLKEVGLEALPEADKPAMLKYVRGLLETRVGKVLTENLADAELVEFDALMEANKVDQGLSWLKRKVPNYQQVVRVQFIKIKAEMMASAPQILEDSKP